jgi:hypothetical protein
VAITDDWAMLQDILVENRCRVAVRMERAWVKRVFADNICDVETIEVRRAMGIDSPLRLLRTKYHRLSRRERTKLCRLLVAHSIGLHREEAKTQKNLLRNAQVILSAVAVGFLNSPVDSIIRIFKREKWSAVIAPENELKFEGLLEPPDTMALPHLGILSAPSSKKISSTFSAVRS